MAREVEASEVEPGADMIDVRDMIARYEQLEAATNDDQALPVEEIEERDRLKAALADLKGGGGDEQWRGDWYPVGLVEESYFEKFAQQEAEDCGLLDDSAKWPATCIDWAEAARQLKQDYQSFEYGSYTYWYR